MERFLHDLKFAGRILWKDRSFAITALLTLGSGITNSGFKTR